MRGDRSLHIPNRGVQKHRILGIQSVVTVHLFDFKCPDEVDEEAIYRRFGEVLSRTLPRSGLASLHA